MDGRRGGAGWHGRCGVGVGDGVGVFFGGLGVGLAEGWHRGVVEDRVVVVGGAEVGALWRAVGGRARVAKEEVGTVGQEHFLPFTFAAALAGGVHFGGAVDA